MCGPSSAPCPSQYRIGGGPIHEPIAAASRAWRRQGLAAAGPGPVGPSVGPWSVGVHGWAWRGSLCLWRYVNTWSGSILSLSPSSATVDSGSSPSRTGGGSSFVALPCSRCVYSCSPASAVKRCSNGNKIVIKQWSISARMVAKQRSNAGQTTVKQRSKAVERRSKSGQTMVKQ